MAHHHAHRDAEELEAHHRDASVGEASPVMLISFAATLLVGLAAGVLVVGTIPRLAPLPP